MKVSAKLIARLEKVCTRRPPEAEDYECVMLGGFGLYAPSRVRLAELVPEVGEHLCKAATGLLSLDRRSLRQALGNRLGTTVDERVFGALLGRALRCGGIVAKPCLSESGRVFRVYVCAERNTAFEKAREDAIELGAAQELITVTEFETRIYPARRWGTWSSASHVLAHCAERGQLVRLDMKLFRWPREIADAVRNHS